MADQEMIDRVAKALWDNEQAQPHVRYGLSNGILFGSEWHGRSIPWEYITSENVIHFIPDEWRNKAKIAIKALREPTVAMKFAGSSELPDYDPSDDDAERCWYNMIDCILND